MGALLQTASAFRIRICILGAAPHSVSVFRIRIPYFTSVFWVQLRIPYLYAVPHICILGADPYSVSVFRIRIYILGADPYSVFIFRIRICILRADPYSVSVFRIRIPYFGRRSVFRIRILYPYPCIAWERSECEERDACVVGPVRDHHAS